MIGYLKGKILAKEGHSVILDIGGVGYIAHITESDFPLLLENKESSLWVYTAVREDSINLYGFLEKKDLSFFKLLITAQGIGPKSAMNILNTAPISSIKKGISSGDPDLFAKLTGIGGKRATKLIAELKDKVEDADGASSDDVDAISALTSLGYPEKKSREVLNDIKEKDLSKKVKTALKILSQK